MKQIISAAVTPFTAEDRLDTESAIRLYEFGLGHHLDGFFVPGTMGEWALLTPEETLALAECACATIGNRAKLLLGVSSTGLPGILRNMERLGHLSHSHWTIVLPGGWAGPSDPVRYVHTIADRADRPLYLYHVPAANGVNLTTAQLRDILCHPQLAGLKNSSGSIRLRKELLWLKREVAFELFEGEEWSIDEALAGGCDGAVAGFGSTGGKLMKTIAAQVQAGDLATARESQFRLIEIFHDVFGPNVEWFCVGQKYALECMGLLASHRSRIDSQQVLPEERKAIIRQCVETNREWLI